MVSVIRVSPAAAVALIAMFYVIVSVTAESTGSSAAAAAATTASISTGSSIASDTTAKSSTVSAGETTAQTTVQTTAVTDKASTAASTGNKISGGVTTTSKAATSGASSQSTNGPLPTASGMKSPTGNMTCGDINGKSDLDDPWLSHALCAVLYASPNWVPAHTFANLMDLTTTGFIILWNIANQQWESIYVQLSEAQAAHMDNDAGGGAWWPAAWRIAAIQAGFPGQVNGSTMLGGGLGTGLQLVTGKEVNVANVTTGDNPMNQTTLTTVIEVTPGSPVILETNSTTSTLWNSSYYTVYSYNSTTKRVYLNGLDGNYGLFNWTKVFEDIVQVAYLVDSETLPDP